MILVLGPHCDDAVFSCGDLLAREDGAVAVTVFAAAPPAGALVTDWDAASGFVPGDDVGEARRAEDRAAFGVVGARGVWLDFLDDQYGSPAPSAALASGIDSLVDRLRPDAVYFPLGLFHRDHVRLHRAALDVARRRADLEWIAYEDAIYRRYEGLLAARLGELRDSGVAVERTDLGLGGASERKRSAIACYRSQLRALATPGRPGVADALAPEGYWRLRR